MLVFFCFFFTFREDKGDQILDYKQEIQTMEDQLKKLQKEVHMNHDGILDFFVNSFRNALKRLYLNRKT